MCFLSSPQLSNCAIITYYSYAIMCSIMCYITLYTMVYISSYIIHYLLSKFVNIRKIISDIYTASLGLATSSHTWIVTTCCHNALTDTSAAARYCCAVLLHSAAAHNLFTKHFPSQTSHCSDTEQHKYFSYFFVKYSLCSWCLFNDAP